MRLRPPVPGDAPSVFEVLVARDIADVGVPDVTLEDVRDEWASSELDLSADTVVGEADRSIVAYAGVRAPGTLAVVAPAHEGRGFGAQLLQWSERRERELGRALHRQWVAASNRRAQALLRSAGYSQARSYVRMVRPLEDHPPEPEPAPGVGLRPVDVDGDAGALHALDDAAFADRADYTPASLAAFTEEHLHAHDVDPGLSRVAEIEGQVAGFALTRRWAQEGAGHISLLAVAAAHRRRGVGALLLGSVFAACAAGGLREAQLSVASDNPAALRLYERVGMRPRFEHHIYERPTGLSGPGGRPLG